MDSIIEEVLTRIKFRAEIGKETYGTTMDRTDLSHKQWLDHAIEEALDLAIYLTKLKRHENNQQPD
jgi:hypothetical protein